MKKIRKGAVRVKETQMMKIRLMILNSLREKWQVFEYLSKVYRLAKECTNLKERIAT